MTTEEFPRYTDVRPTAMYPIPQRTGIRVFRTISRGTLGFFREIGLRMYFTRGVLRAFREPGTWGPQMFRQMRRIGVDSIALTAVVAAFIGAVTAYQTYYQLFPGAGLSAVAFILRQSVMLELGPLVTALVLTGRVGARMTAEIGTMRVTEQIDALETLAYDPLAYLVLPRVLAGLLMFPLLTIIANSVGIMSGVLISVLATPVTMADSEAGLRTVFGYFQVIYPLIKAVLFGGAIALTCSYEGYVTGTGAEGVGSSTARAVVISSVVILALDALTAVFLAQYVQV